MKEEVETIRQICNKIHVDAYDRATCAAVSKIYSIYLSLSNNHKLKEPYSTEKLADDLFNRLQELNEKISNPDLRHKLVKDQ